LGYWFTFTETISLLFTIILLYIGYNWYRFKQLKFAFAKPFQIVNLTLVLGIFGGLIYWLLQPNQMENHNRTVISGEIESETPFKNAFILDLVVNDTIAFVPIQNGKFKFVIDKKLNADFYKILYDEKFRTQLFFGSKDSIHVNSKISNFKSDIQLSGKRLAENKLQKKQANSWSNAEYYLAENMNLDNPDLISDELYDDWKEAIATPNTFRTVDNYMPKNDYVNRSKKLISTKYLNLWNELVQKRLALYPNEKTVENKNIKEIKSTLSLYEEDLLSDET
jgi:hypothetical protein